MFNFDDPLADVKSKEVKRACLNELIAALNDTRGLMTEAVCMELVHMVSAAAGLCACVLNLVLLRYPKPTPKPRFFAKTVRRRNLGFFRHN